jgi:putative radical SAM enzyme (TIGR03279 family)
MPLPRVVAVTPQSPAARAGLQPGDEIVAMNGEAPRDVIAYQLLAAEAELELDVLRGGLGLTVAVDNPDAAPLGLEVDSALFDQVRTCDNHCEFCFIFQLPKGLRKSLYLKDDDYRLSFLYGNFTTLTRFTEADLERVVTERLSPLYVSIHATDPEVRTRMLKNRRGATSLRWLRALLDHGIEVHGQVVVCPGVNDGAVLDDTLTGVLDEYPELATLAVVPLGVSRWSKEGAMRPHTVEEAAAVIDSVEEWQAIFLSVLGRRVVFAADEYYLRAARPFPPADVYEGFPMHEDGIGMAQAFAAELRGDTDDVHGTKAGFFAWVDGAPAEGYRAARLGATDPTHEPSLGSGTPIGRVGYRSGCQNGDVGTESAGVAILTGELGARVLAPLVAELGRDDVRVVAVENRFFGGNIGVTGLLVGEDLARVLTHQPEGHRYLLPDVCLSEGRFLDGTAPADLPRTVEVIPTDGRSLRRALAQPVSAPS